MQSKNADKKMQTEKGDTKRGADESGVLEGTLNMLFAFFCFFLFKKVAILLG